ncbi:SOS response-associated peptidase [Streptacidiphilus sp. EB129]|uniref:SOS response-associated peptidase n=1 Tax=Streptacidiphilus sp. EB129 TaxID=3156262 RepID=UPI003513AA96
MCGRYAASRKPEDLVELFGVQRWDPTETVEPSWNTAPTDPVFAVLERAVRDADPQPDPRPVRQLRALRWGLVPSWAKSADVAVKMFNARAESVHEKPAYRHPFASRRCIVPADGYYEWLTMPSRPGTPRSALRKQPYFITPADGSVLAMAGLYEFWRDPQIREQDDPAAWWCTCTIVTTAAEPALARIHDRMPLMLRPDSWDDWLDPSLTDLDEARALLAPPPPGLLEARPVSAAVGNVRNNGPELTARVEPEPEPETTLF